MNPKHEKSHGAYFRLSRPTATAMLLLLIGFPLVRQVASFDPALSIVSLHHRRRSAVSLRHAGVGSAREHAAVGRKSKLSASTASTTADVSTSSNPDLDFLSPYKYEILSQDPLIYTVFDVLSEDECHQFIDRANTAATSEELTRSNPPEVSLDVGKLWPLPFLCMGAGLPPVVRLLESESGTAAITPQDVLAAALPPILIAAVVATSLAFGVTQFIRSQSNAKSRTSDALALNTEADYSLISDLVSRVCQISGNHPWQQFEAPVLTRYQQGAIFATHNDASPTLGSEWADLGGQRVVTAITYLNDCHTGGGTRFDRLGITVQPRRGMTLVFYPADSTTLAADDRTRHESMEAVEEKCIVQMFGRVGRVPPPLGLPDLFAKEE